MPYTRNRRFTGAFWALLPFLLAFALAWYNSAKSDVKPYQVFREKYYQQNPLHQTGSMNRSVSVSNEQVILLRDQKVIINKTAVVYKGIRQKKVHLDLYILELDPQTAYPLVIEKDALHKGIWFDTAFYRFSSVKKAKLLLQLQNPD